MGLLHWLAQHANRSLLSCLSSRLCLDNSSREMRKTSSASSPRFEKSEGQKPAPIVWTSSFASSCQGVGERLRGWAECLMLSGQNSAVTSWGVAKGVDSWATESKI